MKKNIILSIVAFALIAAAIVGMVVLYRNIDKAFGIDETSKVSETTGIDLGPSASDPEDDFVAADYYFNEENGTGYRTINNVTYFFKKIERSDSNIVSAIVTMKSYASYDIQCMYSRDTMLWNVAQGEYYSDLKEYCYEIGLSADGYSYVTYAIVTNCSNPLYTLSDLNANVFFDTNMFNVVQSAGHG